MGASHCGQGTELLPKPKRRTSPKAQTQTPQSSQGGQHPLHLPILLSKQKRQYLANAHACGGTSKLLTSSIYGGRQRRKTLLFCKGVCNERNTNLNSSRCRERVLLSESSVPLRAVCAGRQHCSRDAAIPRAALHHGTAAAL